jgi:Kef-type K+ transport system membrane component KefB/nucleotide-binding universal stress UspA family protein
MQLLDIDLPHGAEWQFLAAIIVILLGPVLAERVRIPGMVGLLVGGWLIGPNGLGIVSDGFGIVSELGTIGLLYLMFLAGLELDLGVFARVRRQAIIFALLTFVAPLGLGIVAGLTLGYEAAAAVLLGSLLASHTLVTYPVVKRLGLSSNKAIAIAVGATIVTDTLALMVLAVVAGSTVGTASGAELVVQLVLGLGLLGAWCFVALPRLTDWFFTGLGSQRVLRYMFLMAALLSAAVLAEMVNIEGIVGAFFAGLALNRFVPNESSFMERVEFFGAALFIPMFLVSVGTIIDPAVVVSAPTLALAAVFIAACLGGKAIAAALCRPMFGFTWNEVAVVFSLTTPQAAATLAATFVGLQIGLFTVTVVNAVMLLIVVSLLVSSLTAAKFGPRIPKPPQDTTRLGRSVLLHVVDTRCRELASVAARLARSDAGVVHPTIVVPTGDTAPDEETLEGIEDQIARLGIDVEVDVRFDSNHTRGVVNAASGHRSSLIVAPAGTDAWLPTLFGSPLHELVAAASVPVVVVRPGGPETWTRVVLALGPAQARRPGAATELGLDVALRLAASGLRLVVVAPELDGIGRLIGGHAEVGPEMIEATRVEWLRANVGPRDVVVVPGGRNGAIDTARSSKAAGIAGATVVAVADRTSVSPLERVGSGLGVIGIRTDQPVRH